MEFNSGFKGLNTCAGMEVRLHTFLTSQFGRIVQPLHILNALRLLKEIPVSTE